MSAAAIEERMGRRRGGSYRDATNLQDIRRRREESREAVTVSA
jgi:hypothetical protein